MPKETTENRNMYMLLLFALLAGVRAEDLGELNGCSFHRTYSCHPDATCTDNFDDNTWTCKCPEGVSGDGYIRNGVNNTGCGIPVLCRFDNDCRSQAYCDLVTQRCICNAGYQGDGINECLDIDECALESPCDRHAICYNTEGSFRCVCNAQQGYVGDGFTCMHRCSVDNDCLKNQKCVKDVCQCNDGYREMGGKCYDIDECYNSTMNECDENAECFNEVGGYSCVCRNGYAGDGRSCTAVPRNCHEVLMATPSAKSGEYEIDADGTGPLNTIKVTCEMRPGIGITQFLTSYTKYMYVPRSSPDFVVPYDHPIEVIKAVTANSAFCMQYMGYKGRRGATLMADGNDYWVNANDEREYNWGGATTDNTCPCGELGYCENPVAPCNCEGDDSFCIDYGKIIDKSKLPIVSTHTDPGPNGYGYVQIGAVECGPKVFDIPKNCHDAKFNHYTRISYDGPLMLDFSDEDDLGPVLAYCDMKSYDHVGITIIPNRNRNPTNITTAGTVTVEYPVLGAQIRSLIETSGFCTQDLSYDCTNSRLLNNGDRKGYFSDLAGNAKDYWPGGLGQTNKCACGILGICADPSFGCNCDLRDGVERTDFGRVYDKDDLPIGGVTLNEIGGDSRGRYTVGPLMCSDMEFGISPTCQQLPEQGTFTSHVYLIDPDGPSDPRYPDAVNQPPFPVYCEISENPAYATTIVYHDRLERISVDVTGLLEVTYSLVTVAQLDVLVQKSLYCSQTLDYTCQTAPLHSENPDQPYTTWVTRDRRQLTYFSGDGSLPEACACAINDSCTGSYSCFCDIGDSQSRMDRNELTNKDDLPVMAVNFTSFPQTSSWAGVSLGPFMCRELFPNCGQRKLFNNQNRLLNEPSMGSGYYVIDPDGFGGVEPFAVECIGTKTVIETHIDDPTQVTSDPEEGVSKCYTVNYKANGSPITPDQVQALVESSTSCGQQLSQSCLNAPLTGHSNFSTCDGRAQQGWAGSRGEPKCACGVTGACAGGPDSLCHCDLEDGKKRQDGAWILDDHRLAVCQVCVALDPASSLPLDNKIRQVVPSVSDLFCDIGNINGATSCQDWRDNGMTDSDTLMVQTSQGSDPIPVYCNIQVYPPFGITEIRPKEPEIEIPPEGIDKEITYYTYSLAWLIKIVQTARYCTQQLEVRCKDSSLILGGEYGWVSRDGQLQVSWAGNYQGTPTCAGGECQCNKGGDQTDGGLIVDSSKLPVIRVKLGPASGTRTLHIGPVKCYDLYENCEEIRKAKAQTNPMGNNTYAIDPDQAGGVDPFAVVCDFRTSRSIGITEVRVEEGGGQQIRYWEQPYSFKKTLIYQASYLQISALTKTSDFCFQSLQYFCVKTPLILTESIAYGGYKTLNGRLSSSFGVAMDSTVVGCACSATDTCPADRRCHCDGLGSMKVDYGFETNKTVLPIESVMFGGLQNPRSSAIYSVSHVWCGPRPFYLPEDCDGAYKQNYKSGEVLIWPPYSVNPFLVYCDMDNLIPNRGVTIVRPKKPEGRDVTYGSTITIEYRMTTHYQLKTLVENSKYCYQPFKYTCRNTKFLSRQLFYFNSVSSNIDMRFVGAGRWELHECNCGAQSRCGGSEDRQTLLGLDRACNCDANDNETRSDAGVYNENSALPIKTMRFDNTGYPASYGNVIVGNLYCGKEKFDLDECKLGFNDCHENAVCENTPGAYECNCRPGWRGLGRPDVLANGRNCYDDDECALFMCPSSAICTNLPGDYNCTCKDGYKQIGKHRCIDIDECALGTHNCSENARCMNNIGGFECRCNHNYRGNGYVCEPMATCSCFGDPHCITSDGRLVDYQGLCQYVMSRDRCDDLDQKPTFELLTTFTRRNVQMYRPASWVKQATFNVYNYRIELMQQKEVRVNGLRVNLPYRRSNIIIRMFGKYVVVYTVMGVEVTWDGSEAIQLHTPGMWRNQTCGLCGNYNGDASDDFEVGPGCPDQQGNKTDNSFLFGESWVTESSVADVPACAANCSEHDDTQLCTGQQYQIAKTQCDRVFDMNGKFKSCLIEMDGTRVSILYRSCIYDLCRIDQDPVSAVCEAAETLVEACLMSNIPVESFRSSDFCEVTCPDNMEYKPCMYETPRTCYDEITGDVTKTSPECQEGCFCKPGYVMDADECVALENCGCVYEDNYYKLDEEVPLDNCSNVAICSPGNIMDVQGLECHENATCELKNGRYGCHCKENLYGDGVDVCMEDKCLDNPCGEHEICLRNPQHEQGYECRCDMGFLGDCNNCTEIDECKSYEKLCPTFSNCINTVGSFRCDCEEGFTIYDNACIDVDECVIAEAEGVPICGNNSKCLNKMGGYECVCCEGFQKDTEGNCVEVEPATGPVNATEGAEMCCVCELDVCKQPGAVCGKDFRTYSSVRELILSRCERGLSPRWSEAVDYFGPCKSSCTSSLCPMYQNCVLDSRTGLPTCQCESCTEQEITSERVCTSKLDVYKNLCQFKQVQCLLNHEAVPLQDMKPCEGSGGSPPVGDWGEWGPCSVSCGKGSSTRTRPAYVELTGPNAVNFPLSQETECYQPPCPGSACVGFLCDAIAAECVENDAGEAMCECPPCTNQGPETVCGFVQTPSGQVNMGAYNSACHVLKAACQGGHIDAGVINEGHCGLLPVNCSRVPETAELVYGGPNNTYVSDDTVQAYGCLGGCGNLKRDCCRPKESDTVLVVVYNPADRTQTSTVQVELVKSCDCVDLDEI